MDNRGLGVGSRSDECCDQAAYCFDGTGRDLWADAAGTRLVSSCGWGSAARLVFVESPSQGGEPYLSCQVDFCSQRAELQFDIAEPWADIGCDLLAEVPGADRGTGYEPDEQAEKY
jgi:hypothetical protein